MMFVSMCRLTLELPLTCKAIRSGMAVNVKTRRGVGCVVAQGSEPTDGILVASRRGSEAQDHLPF